MRTFYTYEQYAEWHKSSGGVATDGIRLVGSDPSSWPDRYAAQSRIAELEAEVERLKIGQEMGLSIVSAIIDKIPSGRVTLDSTVGEIVSALQETARNDAIAEAAQRSKTAWDSGYDATPHILAIRR